MIERRGNDRIVPQCGTPGPSNRRSPGTVDASSFPTSFVPAPSRIMLNSQYGWRSGYATGGPEVTQPSRTQMGLDSLSDWRESVTLSSHASSVTFVFRGFTSALGGFPFKWRMKLS